MMRQNEKKKVDREFEDLLDRSVLLTLRDGSLIEGILRDETKYNLVIESALIRSPKFEAKSSYIVVNKSAYALISLKPIVFKELQPEAKQT